MHFEVYLVTRIVIAGCRIVCERQLSPEKISEVRLIVESPSLYISTLHVERSLHLWVLSSRVFEGSICSRVLPHQKRITNWACLSAPSLQGTFTPKRILDAAHYRTTIIVHKHSPFWEIPRRLGMTPRRGWRDPRNGCVPLITVILSFLILFATTCGTSRALLRILHCAVCFLVRSPKASA